MPPYGPQMTLNKGHSTIGSPRLALDIIIITVNLRSAGVSGRTRRAIWGGEWGYYPLPPANSRTSGGSEAGEAGIESSQQVLFEGILNTFLKRSQARWRSGQRSKQSLFALSPTEMWLIIAPYSNFDERLLRGSRRLHVSMGLMVSNGQGQVK